MHQAMAGRRYWRMKCKVPSQLMASTRFQLDFGLTGPAFTTAWSLVPGPQRMQGLVPEYQDMEHLAAKEGMPPEEVQDALWQQYFSDPKQWRDNRMGKPTLRHPDFWHKKSKVALWLDNQHKPAWVDSQLATSDAEVKMCRKQCLDGRITEAVDALSFLVQRGCHVGNNLFYRVLKRCIAHKDLVLGRRIHALSTESGYEGDAFLATHLIGLYDSHGRLEEAMGVFTKVCKPSSHNWATIIFAYARHGEAAEAIRLYGLMRESTTLKPDNRIYVAILKACATAGDLVAGKEVHAHILASLEPPDIFVQTGLVNMYANCGSVQNARIVFDKLLQKDVVTWTAMIAGYAQQGMGEEALSLYCTMKQEGYNSPNSVTFSCLLQACASVGVGALHQGKQLHADIANQRMPDDVVLGNSLVNMYAKCGSLDDARRVFDRLPDRNVVTWNTMLAGYAQHGMGHEVLTLYSKMQQENVSLVDSFTLVCLLHACAMVSALPLGKQLHAQIEERGLQADVVVGTALVNMYAKCGSMLDSQQVFDSLLERTIEAWNALTGGYTRQGDSDAVFDLADRMRLEGVQPNGITFLCVLTVCSHVGLLDKGRKYFQAMRIDYNISPTVDHYTCMIDLLGCADHLDEALQMARSMPLPPDGTLWRTLLGACRKWSNVEIGRQAFESAMSVDVKDSASYVLMSNIYASAEMWEQAQEIHARRVKAGAWKTPGQSWSTDIGGLLHTFVVGDKEHPTSAGF